MVKMESYERASLVVTEFDAEDVITTSSSVPNVPIENGNNGIPILNGKPKSEYQQTPLSWY